MSRTLGNELHTHEIDWGAGEVCIAVGEKMEVFVLAHSMRLGAHMKGRPVSVNCRRQIGEIIYRIELALFYRCPSAGRWIIGPLELDLSMRPM